MCCKESLNGPWALGYDTLPGAGLDAASPAPLRGQGEHSHGPTAGQNRAHCLSKSSCRAVMAQAKAREGPALSPLGVQVT